MAIVDDASVPVPRVAVIEHDRRAARVVARVVRAADASVELLSEPQQLAVKGAWDLIIAHYQSLDPVWRDSLSAGLAGEAGFKLLIYSNNAIRNDLAELLGHQGVAHIIGKNPWVDEAELLITIRKMLQHDIFGLQKYFPWGVTINRYFVRRASDRAHVLNEIQAFATHHCVPRRILSNLLTVADELVTNAIFNAPIDEQGRFRYAHLHRSEEVQLAPSEAVCVEVATDGTRIGISTVDAFGTLERATVLGYLAKCFRRGEDQVDQKAGGAGLGLYLAFEYLRQLIVNIAPNRRTEVIGTMDVRGSYRDHVARAKSFHVFVERPGGLGGPAHT